MKKFICKNCGVVNVASDDALENAGGWLDCGLPDGFEWILPAGKITPIVGEPIYISALGEHLSHDAYLRKYYIDPEIAYNMMRGNRNYRSASLNYAARSAARSAAKATANGQTSSKKKANNWLDEDDWTS
jgi:hypothetical protein